MQYCYVTEFHAYDFVIKDFIIKKGALLVPDPAFFEGRGPAGVPDVGCERIGMEASW